MDGIESIPDAAARWGVSVWLVYRWIDRGWLPEATKPGRDWILPAGLPRPKQAVTLEEHLESVRLAPEERKRRKSERMRAYRARMKEG